METRWLVLGAFVAASLNGGVVACSSDDPGTPTADAGHGGASSTDSGPPVTHDSGPTTTDVRTTDASFDAGTHHDGGGHRDGGHEDAGVDSGAHDSGSSDAGADAAYAAHDAANDG